MDTLDLILFLLAIIAIIIIIYYIYKGLSTFGSWLGGSLEDLIKKIEAPFKSVSDFVSNISKSYWQFKEETEKSLTNITQQNLICLISGTCTVADVLKEQEQTQKVIIPPVNRYYYTTEVK